jgi:hypothetical protein
MPKHNEVEIAALGGGAPQRARARNANSVNAVMHQVIAMPHDSAETANRRAALCGAKSKAGWVWMPGWPDKICSRCEKLSEPTTGLNEAIANAR